MKKRNRDLKSWEIIIISIAFLVIGVLVSGAVGGIFIIAAIVFALFSVTSFIRELRTKG